MKKIKHGRTALFCAMFFLFAGTQVFSQTDLEKLKTTVDDFTGDLANSLPFNSTLGLNWSDAHVGKVPHFGVGISLGFTTINADSVGDLLNMFDMNLPFDGFSSLPLPGYTVEGRIGGFVLPFDIGFKFGYLPINTSNITLDYLLVGGDIRYAIVEQNVILPNVSFGVGFNYLSGGVGGSIGTPISFNYTDANNISQTLTVHNPDLNVNWSTATVDFKTQISKSFFFITPYLGFGASHGWSKAGYSVDSTISDTGGNINGDNAKEFFEQFGIDNINANGFSSVYELTGWSLRAFGGLSFNIAIFKIDLTGLYNFTDNNYGASLGFRLQI